VNFDRVAPVYRCLETLTFGGALQRARTCLIHQLAPPRRVLICGEGNGRFLCQLLRVHPAIDIDCVDSSSKMLDLAKRRVLRTYPDSFARVCFIHEDIRNWCSENSHDLIVTHFFFDCFPREEAQSIAAKLAAAATSNAFWLISDFVVPRRGFIARLHARIWLRLMYFFFRSATRISANELIDPTPWLEGNGFRRIAQKISRAGMVKSECFARRDNVPATDR
jgi:ubiquinone/menaquinone biosynthesis C-methylase UbiE